MDAIPGIVIALIGVAGVLVSQRMSVKAADTIRKEDRRIETARRWDQQKREVYVDFLEALDRLRRAGQKEESAERKLASAGDDDPLMSYLRDEFIAAKDNWKAAAESAMTAVTHIGILSPPAMESLGLEVMEFASDANAPANEYQVMRARFVQLARSDLQILDEK